MALFHSHFFSDTLGMQSSATVVIPQAASSRQIGVETRPAREQWPCLWLLHGLSDDHTIWLRRTSIERYAEERGIAVVMPNGHRSFYCDMVRGGAYETFLNEELPVLMRSFFPLSAAGEQNAVAGLSMGGYGAAKWLLQQPDQFIAGASLSGVMDIAERFERAIANPEEPLRQATVGLVYGDTSPAGTRADLMHLVTERMQAGPTPPLLQICGTEDFLIEDNHRFRDFAQQAGYPLTYREGPGDHSWGFWDREIQTVLDWLLEQGFGQAQA
jgi:S-formylglutathione hydrolase FrmB